MSHAHEVEASGIEARIDPGVVIERFPGPACLVNANRQPIVTNSLWLNLGLAGPGRNVCLPTEIAASLLALSHTGRPQRLSLMVSGLESGSALSLDIICLPCDFDGGEGALMLATDRSATELVQAALAEGRDFHRGLALCSGDATFELDQSGRFAYVGPTGFLGHADFELHGRDIRELVAPKSQNTSEFILTSREAVSDTELWFTAQSGEEQCFILSTMPFYGPDGTWRGLRGIGREITGQRTLEAEIRRARLAQQRADSVLHAMRNEARPSMMLAACAAILLESVDIAACVVVHAGEDGFDRVEAFAAADDGNDVQPGLVADRPRLLDLCTQVCRQSDGALRMGEVDDRALMIAPTRYAGRINGAVGFLRELDAFAADDERVWSEDDRHLLRTVAGQVSVAIAQLDLFERPTIAEAP